MPDVRILPGGITDITADAIVNAANAGLKEGGGVCGAIFRAAGRNDLRAACDAIGSCPTGSAVITPGFRTKARFIIHAVGPVWTGGENNEPRLLGDAYRAALRLAAENGCESIAFPLISAGSYGYPIRAAWNVALRACLDFPESSGTALRILFCVPDERVRRIGTDTLRTLTGDAEPSPVIDTLLIGGHSLPAVFFHLPQEPNGFLSNWYPSPFKSDGIAFGCCEQYIMYRKCMLFGDTDSAGLVLGTDSPERQKAIGRSAAGYREELWAGARQAILMRSLYAKFTQNGRLRAMLLATGDAVPVECAGSDPVWACGLRIDDPARQNTALWNGQNILGFALAEVRAILRPQDPAGDRGGNG